MDDVVYILSSLVSAIVAVLLLRGYRAGRAGLLLWSGLCFVGLTINNVFVYLDKVVILDTDLSVPRHATGLAGLLVLVVGLIWESDR